MTETTSGETNSCERRTIEDREREIEQLLDEYEGRTGLPAFSLAKNEATELLELSREQLAKMTAVECGEAAFLLNKFGFHLQRALNRERSRLEWAEESLSSITAKLTMQMSNYYHYRERLALAVKSDDAAQKYDKIRVAAKARIARLDFLSSKVEGMARSLMSLQQSKRGSRE